MAAPRFSGRFRDAGTCVFIGTSITAIRPGDGITSLNCYATLIGLLRNYKSYWNRGVGNDTTTLMNARYEVDVLQKYPGMVAIEVGPNDQFFGVPIATSESNLRSMIGRSKRQGSAITLMVPFLVRDFHDSSVNSWRTLTRNLAAELGCNLYDVYDTMVAMSSAALDIIYLHSDPYHLSASGHSWVKDQVSGNQFTPFT